MSGWDFFRYHGVWAPGVRLMRKFNVRSKVLTLAGVLCLAMAPSVHRNLQHIDGLLKVHERDMDTLSLIDQALNHIDAATGSDQAAAQNPSALYDQVTSLREPEAARAMWQNVLTSAELATRSDLSEDARQTALDDALRSLDGIVQLRRSRGDLHPGMVAIVELGNVVHGLDQLQLALHHTTPAAQLLQAQQVGRLQQQQRRLLSLMSAWSTKWLEAARTPLLDRCLASTQATLAGQPTATELGRDVAAARAEMVAMRHHVYNDLLPELQARHAALQNQQVQDLTTLAASMALIAYFVYCFFLAEHGGMHQVMANVERLARGDLRSKTHSWGSDETAQINDAMNRAMSQFAELMMSMAASADAVCQASEQVASGNESLRMRNQSSVSHVETLVEAVGHYRADVQRCHHLIEEVSNHVQSLQLVSNRTRRQMLLLQEHMVSLRTKSGEIGEIVRLMDAIAFRTNVLALNASVEASKAGEAGRGFAVVAQEVRSLATRSAQSASRINGIVATSIGEIDVSSSLASEACASQQSGDAHVAHLQQAMQDVVKLTGHGLSTCEQLKDDLGHVKDDLHQNQKLVDQLSEASKCLHQQGQKLSLKSRQFSLGSDVEGNTTH